MKPMRKQLLGSVFIALLLLVGCKQPATFGGKPRTKVFHKIISLSPSTTELVGITAVPIIGRTNSCNYPLAVKKVAVVADLKPDYEMIAGLHPDLILVDKDLYAPADIEKLRSIPGVTIKEFAPTTVKEYEKDLYVLANMISGETNVNDYVIKLGKNVEASIGESPPHPITAALIIPDGTGHHMIAGTKSFQADVVRIMGAQLIGPDSNRFESLNPEFLMSKNPDWIIVAGETKTFLADKRFANMPAIKSLKIFGLDQDIVLRRGSRVHDFIYNGHKLLILGEEKKK